MKQFTLEQKIELLEKTIEHLKNDYGTSFICHSFSTACDLVPFTETDEDSDTIDNLRKFEELYDMLNTVGKQLNPIFEVGEGDAWTTGIWGVKEKLFKIDKVKDLLFKLIEEYENAEKEKEI